MLVFIASNSHDEVCLEEINPVQLCVLKLVRIGITRPKLGAADYHFRITGPGFTGE